MNRFLCLTLVLSAIAWPNAACTDEPADFTVATWNLEWFFDEQPGDNYSDLAKKQTIPNRAAWDWKRDTAAEAIGRLNADIVGLQEIESGRVLWYLTKSIERTASQKFRVAFAEGNDTFTEQDVGFLTRNVDVVRTTRHAQTNAMFRSGKYYDLSKHLEIVAVVDPEDANEQVTVIVVHLRATPEAAEFRLRQCRLLHTWIAERVRAGENLIVLGDTNSEVLAGELTAENDLGILCGRATEDPKDDLIDLHERIPGEERSTHLLPNKQFDRILVSRSLVEDAPNRKDLVLRDVRVAKDIGLRGAGADESQQHWEHYWEVPDAERDLSDHLPVVARFDLKP